MSARALARTVGVSPGMISQIERGRAAPSVATLYGIVCELNVSMDELFFDGEGASEKGTARGEQPKHQRSSDPQWVAPSDGPVLRQSNRLSLKLGSGVKWERLTASQIPGFEFLQVTHPVGTDSRIPDALAMDGFSAYGLVLSGRLAATVGEESYELAPGDSLVLRSSVPHRFEVIGDEPVTAVWTIVDARPGHAQL